MARRQTCPPRTDAYAVCSALLDMSASHPAYRASVPAPATEFGYVRHERRPGYDFSHHHVSPARGISAPPRRWSKLRASIAPYPKPPRSGSQPEHKWVQRLRLGWSRLKARVARAQPPHVRGVPDVPCSPERADVESDEGTGVDWVDAGDAVHVFLWDGYWDERDARSDSMRSAASSVSLPLFFGASVEPNEQQDASVVSIMVTPPSPATPGFRTEPETPTPVARMQHGTPTLFPPSNPRFF